MIFGETWEERKERLQRTRQVFAWLPIRLSDGRYAWWRYVERYWWTDVQANWVSDRSEYRYRPSYKNFL